MGNAFKDLTGKTFGTLTVVSITPKRKQRPVAWLCKCDCGKIKKVNSSSLISGSTKSCGAYTCKPNFRDLTGRTFSNLKVIKLSEKKNIRTVHYCP